MESNILFSVMKTSNTQHFYCPNTDLHICAVKSGMTYSIHFWRTLSWSVKILPQRNDHLADCHCHQYTSHQ
nr:Biomphalaria glabrata ankyrin repeat-containing protein C6C3.08-like [Biomphalaria glabrata]